MQMNLEKMKCAMANKCWSAQDLAAKAKVGIATIYNILNQKSNPGTKVVGKIAKALEVPVEKLLKE